MIQGDNHKIPVHVSEHLWHRIIPNNLRMPAALITLSKEQVAELISSEVAPKAQKFFTANQFEIIEKALGSSKGKCLLPKVNNRFAKDLHQTNRTAGKPDDLLQVMLTSEYILETMDKNHQTNLVLRHYDSNLSNCQNFYEVVVRDGYVLAIGQKYCHHIEQQPPYETIAAIFNAIQDILPIINMAMPKDKQTKLNEFIASVYCQKQQEQPVMVKVTSVKKYPKQPAHYPVIFTPQQLQEYFQNIESHKSEQEQYEQNEGVVPLVKTITKKEDVRQYDIKDYLIGHELDSPEKVAEWKKFVEEANDKLKQ